MRTFFECECECGNIKGYQLKYLIGGITKSCGCYKFVAMANAKRTHGLSNNPLYSVYQDMKNRCYNPDNNSFHNYGARQISICQEWLADINEFVKWANENGYKKGLQIDRFPDMNGNYEPSNCRFTTKDINNKNTRRNVFITAFGETKVGSDWVNDPRCKVTYCGLRERLKSGKWTTEDAITIPSGEKRKELCRNTKSAVQITAFGETKSIISWSEDKRCKVGYSGLKIRLSKGIEPEKAISTPFRNK